MLEHFLDPSDVTASAFFKAMHLIHEKVQAHVDPAQPRVPSDVAESYAALLKGENLPVASGTLDDVFTDLARYTKGQIRWNHPGAMINVTPPPSVASTSASSYLSLFNPNGAQDLSSGHLLMSELAVARMISQLCGYDPNRSGGVFTFGGKGTNLHAVKHGVQRVAPRATVEGVGSGIVVVSSTQGHPCHEEVCGWLGLGEEACLRASCHPDGTVDMASLEAVLEEVIADGRRVATIFASGGTTIQMAIDPIGEIVDLRDRLVARHGLDYEPRVHVDAVIGWVFLFFTSYDFEANPLDLSEFAAERLRRQASRIKEIHRADSFGIDFHKTGFCAYSSSLYLAANRHEILGQGGYQDPDHPIGGGGKLARPLADTRFGELSPFQYTFELSRPLNGAIGAYVNLKLFGVEGYQRLMAGLFEASERFQHELAKSGRFEVISADDSDGFVTLFVPRSDAEQPSFFHLARSGESGAKALAELTHGFYLYLLEQQVLGRFHAIPDYSSGYHAFGGGRKIGVLKAYPMSPYFTPESATDIVAELVELLDEFEDVRSSFVPSIAPHVPRPLTFR